MPKHIQRMQMTGWFFETILAVKESDDDGVLLLKSTVLF